MKTLLVSTSSLWNCGDDFIREGVMNLLQLKDKVRVLWWNRGYGIPSKYANDLDINLEHMDYFLAAGTPQWLFKNEKIFEYCLHNQISFSLIGVGTDNRKSSTHNKLLEKLSESNLCELAWARDARAYQTLSNFDFSPKLIPDPCFFKPMEKPISKYNILTWRDRFKFDLDPNLLTSFPKYWLKAQYNRLVNSYFKDRDKSRKRYNNYFLNIFEKLNSPKLVIVHDNREIKKAEKIFGSENVFYSTNYERIFQMYAKANKQIGARIHGAIPALLHKAPARLIYHTQKAETVPESLNLIDPSLKNSDFFKLYYYEDNPEQFKSFSTENHDSFSLSKKLNQVKKELRNQITKTNQLSEFIK